MERGRGREETVKETQSRPYIYIYIYIYVYVRGVVAAIVPNQGEEKKNEGTDAFSPAFSFLLRKKKKRKKKKIVGRRANDVRD